MISRKLLAAGALLAVLAPALAQDRVDATLPDTQALRATATYPLGQNTGQWLGSNLIGAKVVSATNERIGTIGNLIFNDSGTIEAAVIKVGGFMGFGAKSVAVTYDSLAIVRNRDGDAIDHVTVAATKDDLRRAAAFRNLGQQTAELEEKR